MLNIHIYFDFTGCVHIFVYNLKIKNIPTGTATTLPVVFTSGGGNPQKLTGFNGADITAAQIPGTGIYLCWFEHTTNTLQLLTGIV